MARSDSRKRRFGGGGKRCDGRGGPTQQQPRRGPPAVFVTCEGGRERKCRREALDLLHHYYYLSRPRGGDGEVEGDPSEEEDANRGGNDGNAVTDANDDEPLSLEDELAMLRKGAEAEEVLMAASSSEPKSKRRRGIDGVPSSKERASTMKSPFSVYDTGMRGMVCIVCNLPGCEMIPYDKILAEIRRTKGGEANGPADAEVADAEEGRVDDAAKNGYVGGDGSVNRTDSDAPLWDVVDTVKQIFRDAECMNKRENVGTTEKKGDDTSEGGREGGRKQEEMEASNEELTSRPPGSRFITRMLPMQATCFASLEEIKAVAISLLKRCLTKSHPIQLSSKDKKVTFKLDVKRRLCSHLTRDDVIEAVTPAVMEGLEEMPGYKFAVNLTDPDFSIRVETCKSLCGISILPRESWYKNFNLAALVAPHPDDDDAKE